MKSGNDIKKKTFLTTHSFSILAVTFLMFGKLISTISKSHFNKLNGLFFMAGHSPHMCHALILFPLWQKLLL